MSRSGYSDDLDDSWSFIQWRGRVTSALRGKRGQLFLMEMLTALDALPEKKLISNNLVDGDSVCAIGALGKKRGVDVAALDPEDYYEVAGEFDIASPMAQEIMWVNDEGAYEETPEERFIRVRAWVARQIREFGQ